MGHTGGSGRYVEGERVFGPPSGVFDADWAAGLVLDRLGAGAGDRVEIARAAQLAWSARCAGRDAHEALAEAGLAPDLGRAVVGAVDDFTAAYGAGPAAEGPGPAGTPPTG
ncbi:hypothetical protein CLV92_10313 [Kineococcus xinjiangensis]|uniref:Uncharacterized protein n=1 Tax=Kineococcus xinjiangensis TaxID=512762 RepID=A0A2S6ITA9_9ACTN|nr:hypothetical protein [Kineococcus xinjiangensis]PPK97483.1 hypothetical protein CLV92_10313 [Kineococcus xinjiangensis]